MSELAPEHSDVLIVGGGLAGLTLALQLAQQDAALRITVLERHRLPYPESAHKVGESTVEIGAHYFAEVLGLRPHLQDKHLRKFGLRFFFPQGDDVAQWAEAGSSRYLATPSYQIDRGVFENHLVDCCRAVGVSVRDGTRVAAMELGTPHQVRALERGEDRHHTCDWLVDASSRNALIKRSLGLEQDNAHDCNAVWFRIDRRVQIDDWCDDTGWRARTDPPRRWQSTNHLMGAGYWLWLIPLAGGATSVGIVSDPALHDLDDMRDIDRALDWIDGEQALCGKALRGVLADGGSVLDFRRLRNYSHGAKQVFSKDRWAATGEAGVFLDPFYSPGSDFIALSNTMIAALIARDRAGQRFSAQAAIYQEVYFSFYESTLALYQGQYPLLGKPRIMAVKILWDYAYYWAILALLFTQGRTTDLTLLARIKQPLLSLRALNTRVQGVLRDWSANESANAAGCFFDQCGYDWLAQLNQELTEPLDDDALTQRLQFNAAQLESLCGEIAALIAELSPGTDLGAPWPEVTTDHLAPLRAQLAASVT